MSNLLEKSRVLNTLLQKASGNSVEFAEMAKVLCGLVKANIYIASRSGRLLGYAFADGWACPALEKQIAAGALSESFNETVLRATQTALNMQSEEDACLLSAFSEHCIFDKKLLAIVPIIVSGQRQGSLVLTRFDESEYSEEDTILAEYCAMLIGMEILRTSSERIEEEARREAAVQIAIGTLSYSEQEAVEHIFAELKGKEALLVASKIADRAGITRSVIVNALRKLESAGVIETKSLGMKGTYIRVLNENLLDELTKRRKSR
ncbi:MAG: GTP-sensing pleiotropic transcriptional regulator CodY [Clostridiales bacterium]|nr:GTP-sensing pleiotropic transcriptional regulator CodY [Clostridiales bacterium]